jgi:hypothetical protein
MQTCATLVCNTKNNDEQSIICVNYVLSGPQYANIVMSKEQVRGDNGWNCLLKRALHKDVGGGEEFKGTVSR